MCIRDSSYYGRNEPGLWVTGADGSFSGTLPAGKYEFGIGLNYHLAKLAEGSHLQIVHGELDLLSLIHISKAQIKRWRPPKVKLVSATDLMKSWRPPKVELITATDLMKRLEEAGEKERERPAVWRVKEGELSRRIQEIREEWHKREELIEDRIYDVVEGIPRGNTEEKTKKSLEERVRELAEWSAARKFNPYWNTKNLEMCIRDRHCAVQ